MDEIQTKEAFLARLKASYERSRPFGGNDAIYHHILKVEKMTEEQCTRHQKKLNKLSNSPEWRKAIKEMAAEVFAKASK